MLSLLEITSFVFTESFQAFGEPFPAGLRGYLWPSPLVEVSSNVKFSSETFKEGSFIHSQEFLIDIFHGLQIFLCCLDISLSKMIKSLSSEFPRYVSNSKKVALSWDF